MSGFSIYQIGRSEKADIRIDDASVSRFHAELLTTPGGKCYLTDCASSGGTRHAKGGEWAQVKQDFVGLTDPLLLGRYQTSVKQLLEMTARGRVEKTFSGDGGRPQAGDKEQGVADDDRPYGPVRRDEETGDIIPRSED